MDQNIYKPGRKQNKTFKNLVKNRAKLGLSTTRETIINLNQIYDGEHQASY